MRKNIIVNGYWNNNLGDDLFMKILAEKFPNYNFIIVMNTSLNNPFKEIKNIKYVFQHESLYTKIADRITNKFNIVLPNTVRSLFLKQRKKSSVFIDLGGSIFILPKFGMGSLYYFRKLVEKSFKYYVVMGSNFGPYYHKYQLKKYQHLLLNAYSVTFRDRNSVSLISSKQRENNIHYCPDLVFTLNVDKYKLDSEYTLISVKSFSDNDVNKKYNDFIIHFIKKNIKKRKKMVLMSFCENEGDYDNAQCIYNKLNDFDKKYVQIYNHQNIEDSLKIIANADKIIATRYHAMILAWIFKKPVFVISYSEKIENVIKDIAPNQAFTNLNDINENTFVRFTKYPKDYFNNMCLNANKHFDVLTKIMEKINEK
ncbi:MAG TPA: polysaccharide pyruvyl transferase family protein [Candidatus Dwaynia gallinarum]|nr:polysaccharide pyruvyl transferase family protein [Candidatus Dwaynia gallinarum]